MSISFGGLSSGLDTQSIIEALMDVERIPLNRLEDEKTYLESQQSVYSSFDTYLNEIFDALDGLDEQDDLNAYTATNGGSDYFSVETDSLVLPGTYQIEVKNLAQQQKDISTGGVADASEAILSGTLQIGTETLDYTNESLSSLADTINEGDYEVTAMVINDGTENGYRLMLTANESGTEVDIVGTGGVIFDSITNGHSQNGQLAHIVMDGVDIYSTSNVLTEAIKGTTIDLLATSPEGESSYLKIASDPDHIETQLDAFITAYNNMVSYIEDMTDQDPSVARQMNSVQRALQSRLTNMVGSGNYSSLSTIGLETDSETGLLSLDSTELADALEDDYDAVATMLIGDDETTGVITSLFNYMDEQVADDTGFFAIRDDSIESQIERLDDDIERMEARLEKRQETLEAQYIALEETMSTLNSQSSYLTDYFANN